MDRSQARKLAQELVSKMTVEEAASQLRYDAPEIERLGIPEYNWWNECLHGVARAGTATMFPQAIALGATFDKDLMYTIGDVISTEARAKYNEYTKENDRDIYKGLTYWSPNVNLFRDPRWGRGQETFGEDPVLISDMAVPFIKALQGDENAEYMKLAACAKHFAAHSGPEGIRHYFDAIVNDKDLYETYLPQFEACVKEANVESVMGAYNRFNGDPCCGNTRLLKDILRDDWGFEGHVVSDCWAVRDFHETHKVTPDAEASAKMALEAGCDLNCGCTYQSVMAAYREGKISEETIRESAVRLFTTRYMLGMFDKTEFDSIPLSVVECKEHLAVAYKAALESIVLLKNNGDLPLNTNKYKTISVIGPNADSRRALWGNYHGTSSVNTTILQGLQNVAKENDELRILYAEGCDLSNPKPDTLSREHHRIAEAISTAKNSDLVVLCLGLDETIEGEADDDGNQYGAGDKYDLSFMPTQMKLIDAIKSTGKPYIVCVMTGSAMDLTIFENDENAIGVLQVWYPGGQGGDAVADILFGKVSPSAKMPVTVYRDLSCLPSFEDYSMKCRTYRFMEVDALYPFGFGLNYANTKVVDAKLNGTSASSMKDDAKVCVTVSNDSSVKTGDVVQVYMRYEDCADEVRNYRLVGFARVELDGNETKEVEISIPAKAFTVVDDNGKRYSPNAKATFFVGLGGPDARTAALTNKNVIEIKVEA